MPSLPPLGHSQAIRQVVNRLQCEIYQTIHHLGGFDREGRMAWVRNYIAKAVLTLQVNTDGTIAPGTSLLGPFAPGSYSLGVAAGVTTAANRTAVYGFNIDFAKAELKWCDDPTAGYAPLQGDLGIEEWISTVLSSRDSNDPFPRPKSISHRVDFTLDAKAEITPAYVLTRSRGGVGLSAHRKDFHTLDIAVEYVSIDDRNKPYDTKVCVINMPGPCYVPPVRAAEAPKAMPPAGFLPAEERPRRRKSNETPDRRSAAPPDVPSDVQQRLDRALQNLELRSIAPRF